MSKIILSADRTCDIGPELQEKYSVNLISYSITLEDKKYMDSVDVFPDDLYEAFRKNGTLPKTSAINPAEYTEYFKPWVDAGYEVIHITLSSAITSSYQSCLLAAEDLPGVHVIDSRNVSSAIALLVIEAGERIAKGLSAAQIVEEISELRSKSHCSFVLETLDFMKAGGRCSGVAALAAGVLGLKVCIEVDNQTGVLHASKKYRGNMDKVLAQYVKEQLEKYDNINPEHMYITHSGVPQERLDMVKKLVEDSGIFKTIHISRASCTISTHCGPGTLGVLFLEK
ncbi:MAG: DegV family protein [Oscillospiraceae bacterium]|nr:DegV family protein [Oscillospiraceae bacterium]